MQSKTDLLDGSTLQATRATRDRNAAIDEASTEARRWSRRVDTLLDALDAGEDIAPGLRDRLVALRTKRDSVATKTVALRHHLKRDWSKACGEWLAARRELKDAWRSVISAAGQEGLPT